MFRRIEKEMEASLAELMSDGFFDEAKEMGKRLEDLRKEFEGLQINDEMNRQNRQNVLFSKAQRIFNPILRSRHQSEGVNIEIECDEEEKATQRRFQIQDEVSIVYLIHFRSRSFPILELFLAHTHVRAYKHAFSPLPSPPPSFHHTNVEPCLRNEQDRTASYET